MDSWISSLPVASRITLGVVAALYDGHLELLSGPNILVSPEDELTGSDHRPYSQSPLEDYEFVGLHSE